MEGHEHAADIPSWLNTILSTISLLGTLTVSLWAIFYRNKRGQDRKDLATNEEEHRSNLRLIIEKIEKAQNRSDKIARSAMKKVKKCEDGHKEKDLIIFKLKTDNEQMMEKHDECQARCQLLEARGEEQDKTIQTLRSQFDIVEAKVKNIQNRLP